MIPIALFHEYLHIKIRDSLAGFNRFTFDTTFTTWSNATVYAQRCSGKRRCKLLYKSNCKNSNEQPSTDTDMSHWSRIYDYNFIEGTQADDNAFGEGNQK